MEKASEAPSELPQEGSCCEGHLKGLAQGVCLIGCFVHPFPAEGIWDWFAPPFLGVVPGVMGCAKGTRAAALPELCLGVLPDILGRISPAQQLLSFLGLFRRKKDLQIGGVCSRRGNEDRGAAQEFSVPSASRSSDSSPSEEHVGQSHFSAGPGQCPSHPALAA